MGPWLADIISKCPRLKNVYKSNGRSHKISNNKGNKRAEQYNVLGLHHKQNGVGAQEATCGVYWHNGDNSTPEVYLCFRVPHKTNSKEKG